MMDVDVQDQPGRDRWIGRHWNSWPVFCAGAGLLFFLRGLVLVGFSPPFEGFDEPVHMAYIVHLQEAGTLPVFGETKIPVSMYEDFVAYPHPRVAMPVVKRLGGATYGDYYDRETSLISREPLDLYQAQHPPLYYLLVRGLYTALYEHGGILAAIGGARVLNLAFAAVAIGLFVFPLRRILPDPAQARLAALAISLFPMTVIYVARVGNDSLAMMFFAAAYLLLCGIPEDRGPRIRAAAAGLLIGLGTLTKIIAFLLLPAAAAYLVWLAILKQVPWRRAVIALCLLLGGYLLVCGHHHLVNLRQFGTLFSEAGSVINEGAGGEGPGVLANMRLHHLGEFFLAHLIKSNLWMSGWSYLPPHPAFEWIWVGLLAICLGGAIPLARRLICREASLSEPTLYLGVFCLLIVGAVFAGTYAHALNSISAWGGITTPQYYTVAAYPALLTTAAILLAGYGSGRLFRAVAGGLAALFVLTESVSLVTRSLPHWAASDEMGIIFQRLAELHGTFPSPVSGLVAGLAAIMLLAGLVRSVGRMDPNEAPPCRPVAPGPTPERGASPPRS